MQWSEKRNASDDELFAMIRRMFNLAVITEVPSNEEIDVPSHWTVADVVQLGVFAINLLASLARSVDAGQRRMQILFDMAQQAEREVQL